MSSDKYPDDFADEPGPRGPSVDEVDHPVEQDAEATSTADTAGSSADSSASSWAGRQSLGPPSDGVSSTALTLGAGSDQAEDRALALAESLDLLRDSVRDLLAEKRRTTAAAVSLEMRRRDRAFTPEAAGFGKFRDFLRFAEGVGAVTLLPPVPGGDVEVLSAAAGKSSERAVIPATAPRPIRRDLWRAFVDWSPQWQRAFDVNTGRVMAQPTDAGDERTEVSERYSAWDENPRRFRRIVPLTREDQLQWMRAFVSKLPASPEKDQLDAALKTDRPLTAFVEATRANPAIGRLWRQNLTEQVTAAITRWLQREQLAVDLYHMPTGKGAGGKGQLGASNIIRDALRDEAMVVPHKADSSDELRRQVLEAVARMSLSELLRLPIPAEYLLRR